ncbi:MAPEG family protein [soil metagenome]
MLNSQILQPVVVLIAWSLVMLVWMVAVRMPALKKAGIDITKVVGSRPGGLDGLIDEKAQWPAHNYIHLMEQPTLFYAVALTLAVVGWGGGWNATIAWAYVALRIVHSLIQATFNKVSVRFTVFALSTLCLVALTLHAAMAVFGLHHL